MKQKYYLDINGDKVEVTEEIYTEYMRAKWREENQKRRNKHKNFSLEAMNEQGQELCDISFLEDEITRACSHNEETKV